MLCYIVQYATGRAVAYHGEKQAREEILANPGATMTVHVCGHFDSYPEV